MVMIVRAQCIQWLVDQLRVDDNPFSGFDIAKFGKRSCNDWTCISSFRNGLKGGDGGFGGLDRRDAGDAVLNGGGANGAFVGSGPFAAGGVENQVDLFVFHVVDQVRMTFDDFFDTLNGNTGFFDSLRPVPSVARIS